MIETTAPPQIDYAPPDARMRWVYVWILPLAWSIPVAAAAFSIWACGSGKIEAWYAAGSVLGSWLCVLLHPRSLAVFTAQSIGTGAGILVLMGAAIDLSVARSRERRLRLLLNGAVPAILLMMLWEVMREPDFASESLARRVFMAYGFASLLWLPFAMIVCAVFVVEILLRVGPSRRAA